MSKIDYGVYADSLDSEIIPKTENRLKRVKLVRNYESGCKQTPLSGSVEEKRRIRSKNGKHRRTLRVNTANTGTHFSHPFEDKREIRPTDTRPAQNVRIEGELLSYPPNPPENFIFEDDPIVFKARYVVRPSRVAAPNPFK